MVRRPFRAAVAIVLMSIAADRIVFSQGQRPAAPAFQVDPFWPQELPNNWLVGNVVGVAVDSRDNVWIVGSPATVVRKIRELHASVGGFGGLLIGATDWSDASIWRRSMDLFAAEVMPRLADLDARMPVASGGGRDA